MFCTKCGIELKDQVRFCSDCGTSTGRATPMVDRLTRPMHEAKIGGVCAGFARYFGLTSWCCVFCFLGFGCQEEGGARQKFWAREGKKEEG